MGTRPNTRSNGKRKNREDEELEYELPTSEEEEEEEEEVDDGTTEVEREERETEFIETVGNLSVKDLKEISDFTIQSSFSLYDHKHVMVIDIGSFSKGSIFSKDKNQPKFNEAPLKFNVSCNTSAKEFARTILYYSESRKEFTLKEELYADAIAIHSLKKLFTVLEANTYTVKDSDNNDQNFEVSDLMYRFIKCLLDSTTLRKRNNLITTKIDSFIFTVPTDTPKHVKLHYKSKILKAIEECFLEYSNIEEKDIYIIEEYILLYYNLHQKNGMTLNKTVMIIDFGHLTTDITVINNKQQITYANGEVGGAAYFHKVIEENTNENSFQVMEDIFHNGTDELPEQYAELDVLFKEACKNITEPILDVILQTKPDEVILCGAFVSNVYFKNLIEQMLSFEKLKQYYDDNEYISKDLFKPNNYEVLVIGNPGSALLVGASNMLNQLAKDSSTTSSEISLEFPREVEPFQNRVAFLFFDEFTNQHLFKLTKNDNFLYVKQDIEMFILKIRNTIDIEKLEKTYIGIDNYRKIGIAEFERFSTANIWFDPSMSISVATFFTVGEIFEDSVQVSIIYKVGDHYSRHIFRIPRQGRMERLPLNDIDVIFNDEEENRTWYGTQYDVHMVISGSRGNRIYKSEITELDKDDFSKFTAEVVKISDEDVQDYNKHHSNIPLLDEENDVELYNKRVNFKCIQCGKEVHNDGKNYKITNRTVFRYREAFSNRNISTGSACHACHKLQRNYFDRKRRNSNKKTKIR